MTDFLVKDHIIYQEMMAHPALFMHPHPKKIAIIGDEDCGILQEVLRHPEAMLVTHVNEKPARLIHHDERIQLYTHDVTHWIQHTEKNTIDILIIAEEATPAHFKAFFELLNPQGLMIQQSVSPFQIAQLKTLQDQFTQAGFTDIHFSIYPQPHFPSGMRTAILAKKHGNFHRIREKDIFNKPFHTNYYNFDIHKASLVLPEFMRKGLHS